MINRRQPLFSLLLLMLLDHLSLTITFPILTLLFFDQHTRLFTIDASAEARHLWYGYCLAIPHLINVMLTPILSAMSDAFGRKKILLLATFGAFLFAMVAALGVVWGSLSLLLAAYVLKGMFSRTNPISQAVIGDTSPIEKKVLHMGYLQASISIGAFLGPMLGGYLAYCFFTELNFATPYLVAAFFAAMSWLVTFCFFPETLIERHVRSPWQEMHWQNINALFRKPKVRYISAILLLSQLSWSLYYQFIPPILKEVCHFTGSELGMFIGFIAGWLALATLFGIKWLDQWFDLRQMLMISLYLVMLGLLITLFFCARYRSGETTILLWIAAIPISVGDVIAFSCVATLYSNVVIRQDQGKIMGICFIVIGLIWAITSILGGIFMSTNVLLPLIAAPFGVFFGIVLLSLQRVL